MTQMNLFTKQTQTQTQRTNLELPKGKGGEKDTLGVWDEQIQSITHKIHTT